MEDGSAWIIVAGTALALFVTTFLRGFQNKSVAAGHKKLAFIGGCAMSALELYVMSVAGNHGGKLILLACIGAGIGWVAGMIAHDLLMRKRHKEEKARKKTKRQRQFDRQLAAALDDHLRDRGLL